jgi:hypothetical protein
LGVRKKEVNAELRRVLRRGALSILDKLFALALRFFAVKNSAHKNKPPLSYEKDGLGERVNKKD